MNNHQFVLWDNFCGSTSSKLSTMFRDTWASQAPWAPVVVVVVVVVVYICIFYFKNPTSKLLCSTVWYQVQSTNYLEQ